MSRNSRHIPETGRGRHGWAESPEMTHRFPDKTYRVVGIRSDGIRVFVQGELANHVADAMQAVMLSSFPDVLIEEERLTFEPFDTTSGLAPGGI
jgi:hypothetical protein